MPSLSIIIPTLNSSNTLPFALESILHQSFTDFEILIIDGLSTDNTLEIAQSYRDERIKIFSEKDKGIYDAMNKGIETALGEWLYFLGADDRLYDQKVLKLISEEISGGNYDVLYGDVYSSRFNGRYAGEFNNEKILNQNLCHQAVFFKKEVFKITGVFDLKYNAHADWDHNMRWLLSPKISKSYINCIIAEYADGGFSSLFGDPKFEDEKLFRYLIYGKTQINRGLRISLIKHELIRTAKENNKYLFLKLVLNIPRIIIGA